MPCELQPTPSKARTERFKVLGLKRGEQPKGHTVDASCRNPLCAAKDHVLLRQWASIKTNEDGTRGGLWGPIIERLSKMEIDTYFDLPEYPRDEENVTKMRSALHGLGKQVRAIVRMLPTGGVRLIRIGTWGYGDHEYFLSDTRYPNLMQPPAKPSNQLGSPWLGMLWGTWDVPRSERGERVQTCKVRACAFPSIVQGICRHHSRFFVYRSNRDDIRIDHMDMWSRPTDENPNPDPYYTTGWLTEDKSNFLNVRTERNGVKTARSRGEIQNDKWWKENVIDKGIDTGDVVSRKNMLYAAEQRKKVQQFDAAMEEISAASSAANIRAFYGKKNLPQKKKRKAEEQNFRQLSREEIREMGFSEHRFDYEGAL